RTARAAAGARQFHSSARLSSTPLPFFEPDSFRLTCSPLSWRERGRGVRGRLGRAATDAFATRATCHRPFLPTPAHGRASGTARLSFPAQPVAVLSEKIERAKPFLVVGVDPDGKAGDLADSPPAIGLDVGQENVSVPRQLDGRTFPMRETGDIEPVLE